MKYDDFEFAAHATQARDIVVYSLFFPRITEYDWECTARWRDFVVLLLLVVLY